MARNHGNEVEVRRSAWLHAALVHSCFQASLLLLWLRFARKELPSPKLPLPPVRQRRDRLKQALSALESAMTEAEDEVRGAREGLEVVVERDRQTPHALVAGS